VRVSADAGTANRFGFGWVRSSVSSRLRRDFREVFTGVDARWMVPSHSRHVLVANANGIIGENTERDFEVVVGGLNGLRAYPIHQVAGRRMLRLNLEQRWLVARNVRDLFALGIVTFADAAKAGGPGSGGAGLYAAGGAGVRLSFPRWSPAQIVRVDLSWPISPTRDGQRIPVLTFGSSQAF
jgi:hypothetical protein